ncbi:hypothetical protein TruAng_007792 [Truncatella angustata]|nr:hypothetical protein TruAng_007792 [Truncatella angustata]
MAVRVTSEFARERETYKYAAAQLAGSAHQVHAALINSSALRTSRDTILTGLAELVALRTNATRATVSLFDKRWQYVIAEATPRLTLHPSATASEGEQLLLCGTAVPRSVAICDHVLLQNFENTQVQGEDLPVSVIQDTSTRLANNPYFKSWPHRFYAGVPIRTSRDINIGVLSIYDDDPREELDATSVLVMQDISRAIMDYLAAFRSRDGHRRADRMVRGVGTFVEGESSLAGWQGGADTESFQDNPTISEGSLNARQQTLQRRKVDGDSISQVPMDVHVPSFGQPSQVPTDNPDFPTDEQESEDTVTKLTFSKAANILRESIEVEGALFLDASISSFGGGVGQHGLRSSSSSSSEDSSNLGVTRKTNTPCRILGFSNSSASSIDGGLVSEGHSAISERLLSRLIKCYPNGKIFNFDSDGSPSSGEGEDTTHSLRSPLGQTRISTERPNSPARNNRKTSFSRKDMAKRIGEVFPNSRSVAFIPVWDSHRQRWFSGGFVYTHTSSRVFTSEGELSYLSAFASILMAEIHRTQESFLNKTKTDLLGSLSHELRSPLHGVVLGAELLQDTELDVFQRDVLNSIENCCRTLMGTIDHLLDWTKINKFKLDSLTGRRGARSEETHGTTDVPNRSIEAGMMSRTSNVDVGAIAEQVVESIFAGHSFQTMAVLRMVEDKQSGNADVDSMRMLDSMQAVENVASYKEKSGDVRIALGGVVVTLSIDASLPWVFDTQPGAIQRITMNILGNALKFTSQGFVEVRLTQEKPHTMRSNMRLVTLTISDTGRGIEQDFLKHELFTPFMQEDSLAAGLGLGLSLVKRIVSALGGAISVESTVGQGSTITVKLPLKVPPSPPNNKIPGDEAQEDFLAHIAEIRGLRISITGYPPDQLSQGTAKMALFKEYTSLTDVCKNWLQMRVIEEHEAQELLPDLILCGDRHLEDIFIRGRNDSSTPIVIICRSALAARQLATSPRFSPHSSRGIYEFISQPLGPRKLAKVLLQCFRRWTRLQEAALSTRVPSDCTEKCSSIRPSPIADLDDVFARQFAGQSLDETERSNTPKPLDPFKATETNFVEADQVPTETTDTPEKQPSDAPPVSTQKPVDTPKIQNRVARYLLVDDNAINLRILATYMKKLGHAYDTASDGLEALKAFEKGNGQYRCIFMDISMPVMDGFESTRRVRALEREKKLSRCSVYALSGLASASAQQEAFASEERRHSQEER